MGIVSGIVLYAALWFMVLFVVLPIRLETQGERGEVVPGTPEGAPANLNLKRKLKIVSLVTLVIWAIVAAVVLSGVISVSDLDWTGSLD